MTRRHRRHPLLLAALACVLTLSGLFCLVAGLAVGGLDPGQPAAASPLAARLIPAAYLGWYQQAAAGCPGLDWTVLAAVGTVESGNGANNGPSAAGAVGPMQFLPATFAGYDHPVAADPTPTPVPPGAVPASPWDPVDAVWAAARYMCALGSATNPHDALVAYNCGNPGPACQAASAGYAAAVLGLAGQLGAGGTLPSSAGSRVVGYARSQLGVPYRWGAESPGVAFDCSGLAQWAYAQVGIPLPRVAQAQYDAGPARAPGQDLVPGDLVFFGAGPGAVGHVGISLGGDQMIDAPNSGTVVRVDTFTAIPGAAWGSERYLGATRP